MAQLSIENNFHIYQPRNPKASAYYKCVENHFEELEQIWDVYKSRYGFWRTYVMAVIYKYLDCGDLHFGFARVHCEECGHEYLDPSSEKWTLCYVIFLVKYSEKLSFYG